jgi:hypothetical protein
LPLCSILDPISGYESKPDFDAQIFSCPPSLPFNMSTLLLELCSFLEKLQFYLTSLLSSCFCLSVGSSE